MFKIGDMVTHNVAGLCKISDIITCMDKEYYVLNKHGDNKTKIMIPVDSKLELIRNVITKKEIYEAIKNIPNIEVNPIYDYRIRTREYDKLLKSGNVESLFKLIKTLHKQKSDGKTLTEADKKIIEAAEELIDTEFSYSLKMDQEDVKKYILDGAGI